jgi:hypothetical protein
MAAVLIIAPFSLATVWAGAMAALGQHHNEQLTRSMVTPIVLAAVVGGNLATRYGSASKGRIGWAVAGGMAALIFAGVCLASLSTG